METRTRPDRSAAALSTHRAPLSLDPRQRLDRVVSELFAMFLPSRAAAKAACKRGDVLVDGSPAEPSRWIAGGETLTLLARRDALPAVYTLALELPFEDDHMAIIYKPPGYPTSGNRHQTIDHALPFNLTPSTRPDALPRPLPAHRLDAGTQGLLVVGKTGSALARLNAAFRERRVTKRYRAIVAGALFHEGVWDGPIDGLWAETRYEAALQTPSHQVGTITTVNLWPTTGRTHQLRRHLAEAGHPVLGDHQYRANGLPVLRGRGLFLASVGLSLPHPVTAETLTVEAPEPAKFQSLRGYSQRSAAAWGRRDGGRGDEKINGSPPDSGSADLGP